MNISYNNQTMIFGGLDVEGSTIIQLVLFIVGGYLMYRINEFITPAERLDAMRLGGLKKLASAHITPSEFTKLAGDTAKLDLLGATLRTSLILGIPAGVLWYALHKDTKKNDKKTEKYKAELDQYNNMVHTYKNKLQN